MNAMLKKIILVILFIFVSGSIAVAAVGWYTYKKGTLQTFVIQKAVSQLIPESVDKAMIQKVLGFDTPRTYLVLFLNNTEIRPGGGFIGSYAVVRIERGVPHIIKVDGTEIIDNYAPDAYLKPPAVLEKYLFIKKMQFRDSNWSPDFPTAASTSLALYRLERGVAGAEIDGVIAFTPTVIEELLKITGPLELEGEQYTSKNFTEKLEYEVEYGFAKKGVAFRDRKQTLDALSQVALGKVRSTLLGNWSDYKQLVPRLLEERHIMVYATDPTEERFLRSLGWAGDMKTTPSDYLLWVDANLGALKTDVSIERNLTYTIAPSGTAYIGSATMRFKHKGSFDWRTTRYRDYVRVYVPLGSTLIEATGVMKGDKDARPGEVAQGIENGRQWFGGFISIEPGKSWELTFRYKLAPAVVASIHDNSYQLFVQKQLGTLANRLTLRLGFDTKVTAAEPSEKPEQFGDRFYDYEGDLRVDKLFKIQFTQ